MARLLLLLPVTPILHHYITALTAASTQRTSATGMNTTSTRAVMAPPLLSLCSTVVVT
jgi:hypothetical protein